MLRMSEANNNLKQNKMEEHIFNKVLEIEALNTEKLKHFGYNSTIGLFDANNITPEFYKAFETEFFVDNKYYSLQMNNNQDEFLITKITKKKFKELSDLYN